MFGNWKVVHNYDHHYNGRIWFFYNLSTISIDLQVTTSQMISCKARHYGTNKDFCVSIIYGYNDASARTDLWNELRAYCTTDPWIVLGDFNIVRSLMLVFLLAHWMICLASTGRDLTWTNKQDASTMVWSKLDRVLVNTHWFSSFPNSYGHFMEMGVFDHSHVLVFASEDCKVVRRFSFLNSWINHPDYVSTITNAWCTSKAGSPSFCFFEKLKNVKHALTGLHKRNFSQIQEERHRLAKYSRLKTAELDMLFQRAKLMHIQQGDSCSKYFLAKINDRKHQQIIGVVQDQHGVLQLGLVKVSPIYHSFLTQPVSCQEIQKAVFSIDFGSSPGIDGFSSGFFKSAWHIIDSDSCSNVHYFFKTGHMPKQANSTLISLIPKKIVDASVMDYRPISCCTVFYKTISKILTNKLQQVLPTIIGEEQVASLRVETSLRTSCCPSSWSKEGMFHLVLAIKNALSDFAELSGLAANVDKTNIYFGGVSTSVKQAILLATGFSKGSFPFRLQLINSIVFGLENFWSSCILLPMAVVKQLNQHYKDFFWGCSTGHRKMVFKSWKHICSPWESGGFNIKDAATWNISLLLKWVWKLSNPPEGLWARCWAKGIALSPGIVYKFLRPYPFAGLWTNGLACYGIIPSTRVICSLATQHQLATVVNIKCRGFQFVNRCLLCEQQGETHDHLFFQCPFYVVVWCGILKWMGINRAGQNISQELATSISCARPNRWKKAWFHMSLATVVYQPLCFIRYGGRGILGSFRNLRLVLMILSVALSTLLMSRC
ncbi:uncharacterized protein LOC141629239 [Silene latifolia]|uniref:uncharacterized protein LOC141629239 n=1 Tax=Silene latifolia TaxID=37657 RepID=UPI003D78468D